MYAHRDIHVYSAILLRDQIPVLNINSLPELAKLDLS
jgi:hypothetical protein